MRVLPPLAPTTPCSNTMRLLETTQFVCEAATHAYSRMRIFLELAVCKTLAKEQLATAGLNAGIRGVRANSVTP